MYIYRDAYMLTCLHGIQNVTGHAALGSQGTDKLGEKTKTLIEFAIFSMFFPLAVNHCLLKKKHYCIQVLTLFVHVHFS